jgi:prephenate dehydrogenase
MAQAVGARPLLLDAPCHDALVAAISHLPYLLAVGLVATAERLANDTVWEVAASGFRDTSRLAASDEAMMLDILLTNRTAVRRMLARFQDQLAGLAHLLETGDEAGLRAAMTAAAQRRRRLFQ